MNKIDIKNKQASNKTRDFKEMILSTYKIHKRDNLPWRKTRDPYAILVSEIMLQQTQADRVIPKYEAWIKRFPNVQSVHKAVQKEILTYWQGLGYNKRALFLKKTCDKIILEHKGVFPFTYNNLIKLPGVGQSTAGAIMNFAFNKPQPFIETNIRTIFLHHFFKDISSVSDIKIMELVTSTMDTKNSREWFYALYDYGTLLKKQLGEQKTSIHKQSKHYNKQSKFSGSDRQIRGAIIRFMLKNNTKKWLVINDFKNIQGVPDSTTPNRINDCLLRLVKEGLVAYSEKRSGFAIL